MSSRIANAARLRRRVLSLGALACALGVLTLAIGLAGGGANQASGQTSSSEDTYQTDSALPAIDVTMFGASPQEAPSETWGIGRVSLASQDYVIVDYVAGRGWTRAPAILESSGQPLSGFTPANNALTGEMTPDGAGALVGFVGQSKVILVRSPGQAFQETSLEPAAEEGEEALLQPGEELFSSGAPLVAALEEGSSSVGTLVVPGGEPTGTAKPAVLHWEAQGQRWTREPIELPAGDSPANFKAVAIAASSPTNAWLLAQASGSEAVSLFRRQPGSGGSVAMWKPVAPGPGQEAGAPLVVGGEPVVAEPGAQALTVTEGGVWVDGERRPSTGLTLFFQPSPGEPDSGSVAASWCNATAGEGCTHELPEELPSSEYRSYAWASSSAAAPFGERVITGLPEGVMLRLNGSEFTRVVTVGGPEAPDDVGGSRGAAFSNAFEGWLGNDELPVHATREPAPEKRLGYWPTPFHKPLLAIAAEPGVPVGPLASEALAVGESGEVARYTKPEGCAACEMTWEPETLFNGAGKADTESQLRSVAWPTPERAYAVGVDPHGEAAMWLWRGETKLWEPDPAVPVNLSANLLGIAFEPGDPDRGYVVGQGGTLLRYGKTWTQEVTCEAGTPQPCLPAEVAGASFTSVAFAGSEALVTYRVPHLESGALGYTGGLLVNNGSGWAIDSEVHAALGTYDLPWTVAGQPDGAAALSAANPEGQAPQILERGSQSAAWEPTPEPYPGFNAPASLTLFTEGGALRVVGVGAIPDTVEVDNKPPPPAGSPPNLLEPYPLGLADGILRQSATGWIDEEPERRVLRPPPGGFVQWDIPYTPDATATILLSEDGSSGWAVGGQRPSREAAETADIARYPAEPGSTPPGVEAAPVELETEAGEGSKTGETIPLDGDDATFAVGGNAQCAAVCADVANDQIGPDVWLTSALAQAAKVHVKDFLYTGARLTTGASTVRRTSALPYAREFERYAAVLSAGSSELNVAVAASSTDRVQGSLCDFETALAPFLRGNPSSEGCATGQSAYYAFTSPGTPTVRVIVLDDSSGVGPAQLQWLEQELKSASENALPAIVVGSADLSEEVGKHEESAEAVANVLLADGASTYLFDSPEQNVKVPLGTPSNEIWTFGSGTLGYVTAASSEQSDFIGANGFLLVVVKASERNPANNRAPVIARLVPAIGELSLDAEGGTLLRRSSAAEFSALARRPRAGGLGNGNSSNNESASFIPIPANCQGGDCNEGITPEYRFTSSDPEVGKFVAPNLHSAEANAVELDAHEEPIEDAKSGLFCALNKGETTVKIEAGGLSASLRVVVQEGSVRRPCGTTPLKESTAKAQEHPVPTPVQPTPSTGGSPATTPLVPVPPPPAVVAPAPPPVRVPAALPPPFLLPPLTPAPAAVIVPPPLPPVAEPTPPSGTSAVTSPVEAAQREEDQEEATESVSAQAVAYSQSEHEPSPAYLLGLIVLAAFAGATIRRRTRRGGREVRVAPSTLSGMQAQRRLQDRARRPW